MTSAKTVSFLAGILFFTSTSCSFERYSKSDMAEVKIQLPRELLQPRTSAGPGDYASVDCFLVDVNGPGIEPLYPEDSPFTLLDLGLNSTWIRRAELVASGSTTLSIRVPIGRSRTVRILGVTGITGACADYTFKGYPDSGVLSAPPYPVVNELARANLDVFSGRAIATAELADRSEDMIPNNTFNAPGRAALIVGNSLSDFSEGAPGAAAFFTWGTPGSTDGIAGKARLDIVLNISNENVRSYRGLQVRIQAAGGNVATCGSISPAILNPSNLVLGLWNEGRFEWEQKTNFILSSDQGLTYTTNFSGLNFENVRTSVTDSGGTFVGLYLSLRVQDTPASGCSAINITSMSAELFQ
jgi:hypothetical protein